MAIGDVRDFLAALSAARVDFVVVGAHALAAHGRVRATGDLDVLVAANPTNARRLERAVRTFAEASLEFFGVSVDALSRPRFRFFMGVELIAAKRASARKRPLEAPKRKQDEADLAWLVAERRRLRAEGGR